MTIKVMAPFLTMLDLRYNSILCDYWIVMDVLSDKRISPVLLNSLVSSLNKMSI
jgi:hypothetical protein